MKKKTGSIKPEQISNAIFSIRNQRMIMDKDLAFIYGVPVKRLNEAVNRNRTRFPEDFIYQLTRQEVRNLRSQFATSSWGGRRYLPYAFSEHGAIMAANILNSDRAIEMSVFVVRAFVKMRAVLSSNKALAEELRKLESKLTGRLDAHELAIVDILRRLMKLLEPQPIPSLPESKPKGPIGFQP